MNRIIAIFAAIILLTIGSFAVLWAISPEAEQDRAMATQGIRLVGSAVFYNTGNATTPNRIKVGDLLIGTNEQVFRINELRKSQSNTIYVVVSWKYITDYTTYADYLSEPYSNYKTYELNSFAYTKTVITEPELAQFYATYSSDLTVRHEARREREVIASDAGKAKSMTAVAPPEGNVTVAAQATPLPTRDSSVPRNILRATNSETLAYSTAEVSAPEITTERQEEMQKVLSRIQRETK